MSERRTYLDWNATSPLRTEARDAMVAALDEVGNPSSVHAEGRRARAMVEAARAEVAALTGARAGDVHFTSGATEANNWVIRSGWSRIMATAVEHDSVIQAVEAAGVPHVVLPVDGNGVVRLDTAAEQAAGAQSGRGLVAVQLANNETGVLQPVADVVAMATRLGYAVLADAAQVAGRMPLRVGALGVDYLTLSAHKLGGPKGVGALIVREGAWLRPLIAGGGQERRQRAGTENVAGIVGFGAAAAAARREQDAAGRHMAHLRDDIEAGIAATTPDAVIVGRDAPRLPNTTCVALPGRRADVLVAALDLAGIAVSAGAACSSGKVGPNRVLEAMGLAPEIAGAAIRVSLGSSTRQSDIVAFLAAWQRVTQPRRRAA